MKAFNVRNSRIEQFAMLSCRHYTGRLFLHLSQFVEYILALLQDCDCELVCIDPT